MNTEVPVVIASDNNYVFIMSAAIVSLFENKKGDYPVRLFIMDGGISRENKEKLGRIEKKYNFSITYIPVDNKMFEGFPTTSFWPIATYYRLAAARLLPASVHKLVYLDCDVIVLGDIQELFKENLDGYGIGIVRHNPTKEVDAAYKRLGLSPTAAYFNAGVLLIDLDFWRREKIEEQCVELLKKRREVIHVVDQDMLNIIFENKAKLLPWRYNSLDGTGEHVCIRHFADSKPWYRLSAIPFHKDWVRYMGMTPLKLLRFRKFMHISFAQKYHLYPVIWFYNLRKYLKK